MIIDGKLAILGSHNYTMSAFTKNLELSVVLDDEETLGILGEYFKDLWQA